MAAHNAQATTVTYNPTLNNVPVNSYVWNRSWYAELSGGNNSGNVTLNFNFSDYNGSTPNAGYNFGILYNSTSGTFGSGTNKQVSYVSYSVSGNVVSFVVKAANLSTGYYTIIYNQNNVLPITLESFSAAKLSSSSALAKWTVGPDFGSGSFSIERSADGIQFSTIGTVEAVVDESGSESYSFVDNSPLFGMSYYRIAMTNGVGEVSYSAIVPVEFGSSSRQITLYPVPATDVLHISAPGVSGVGTIELFSVAGQLLANYQVSTLDGASLPVSGLSTGTYFVRIKAGVQPIALSFVKR